MTRSILAVARLTWMKMFEELDYCPTPMGALSLRRRRLPGVEKDIYEIKIGDDFLMSSRFTASESALAEIGLDMTEAPAPDIVVGGLGLGYTARRVLESKRIASLVVVEVFGAVIDWHRRGLVPIGPVLTSDPRCSLVEGDFFRMAVDNGQGFDPNRPGRRFDAVLVDIDHSPGDLLSKTHEDFYTPEGLLKLAEKLKQRGVFALWSNDPPDHEFVAKMKDVFVDVDARIIEFDNPLQGRTAHATIYAARRGDD